MTNRLYCKVKFHFLLFRKLHNFCHISFSITNDIAWYMVFYIYNFRDCCVAMNIVTSSSPPSDISLSKVLSRFASAEGKPFICTINATGPNLLPWGTPPLTATLSDTSFPNLAIWVLPLRYDNYSVVISDLFAMIS